MTLEKFSQVAVILTCGFVCSKVGVDIFHGVTTPTTANKYKAGLMLKSSHSLDFKTAPMTLIMMTSSHCGYCSASMEFYRKLLPAAKKEGVRVVGLASEDPTVNKEYLRTNGVEPDTVLSSESTGLQMVGTPTLLLVGRDARVVKVWSGRLPSAKEEEVLKALASVARAS